MVTRDQLAEDFRRLGVAAGDVVMVHASVRAVGPIAGGADQIHLALKDALTEDGTLLMYAGCPEFVDEVGRGNLTLEQEAEVLEKLPAFDAWTARSARDNGALVEMLRTYPGSRVNEHVTRFVAWGRHAEYLFSEQPWDFAFGRGSALERFAELGGKILLLGCDHDTVTFLHHVEHMTEFPGKRIARFQVPVLEEGVRVWRAMAEVDSSGEGAHANWPPEFFAQLVDAYMERTGNGGGLVGAARSHLLDASGLMQFVAPWMCQLADDAGALARLRLG